MIYIKLQPNKQANKEKAVRESVTKSLVNKIYKTYIKETGRNTSLEITKRNSESYRGETVKAVPYDA